MRGEFFEQGGDDGGLSSIIGQKGWERRWLVYGEDLLRRKRRGSARAPAVGDRRGGLNNPPYSALAPVCSQRCSFSATARGPDVRMSLILRHNALVRAVHLPTA
jgi:hypothetical protein